jgi:hypothetical protein
MKKALAVICYAREWYFDLVLTSIGNQRIFGKPVMELYDIHLFQDGIWSAESEANVMGHARIGRTLEKLSSEYRVHRHKENLGVALHFDLIERTLFEKEGHDFVVFCEDDMILAPGYMQVMDLMAEKFAGDDRIGMISAHPLEPRVAVQNEEKAGTGYDVMGHNWGFGIWNHVWKERKPLMDAYYKILEGKEYRERDNPKIYRWLRSMGYKADISSQDYARTCCTHRLGRLRLATSLNYGLPIGSMGLHCRHEAFQKMGLDKVLPCHRPPVDLPDLSDDEYARLLERNDHIIGEEAGRYLKRTRLEIVDQIESEGEFRPYEESSCDFRKQYGSVLRLIEHHLKEDPDYAIGLFRTLSANLVAMGGDGHTECSLAGISRLDEVPGIEKMVSQIYQGLLGKKPDVEEMARYSEIIMKSGGIEECLTRIIASAEFALIHLESKPQALCRTEPWNMAVAANLVDQAYLALLGRKPLPTELELHAQHVLNSGDLGKCLQELVESEEFENRKSLLCEI